MKKRKRMNYSKSRKLFRRTASRPHPKNVPSGMPMRGGIRL